MPASRRRSGSSCILFWQGGALHRLYRQSTINLCNAKKNRGGVVEVPPLSNVAGSWLRELGFIPEYVANRF